MLIFSRGGKTLSYTLVAFLAFAFSMATASFAAERTISGAYTLTANEDWTGDSVTLERGAMVDLAGHNLAVGVVALGSGSGTATFTDSSAGTGELRFTIPSGATFTKTADIAITGNLALVKDGAGLFSWNGGTLAADIPIVISDGTFKLGVTTANVFGSSGTITVNGTGQFDLNYTGSGGGSSPVLKRTFYIEGDGPDGFGAIVNNATLNRYGKHLEHVFLTGDATIGGKSRIDFRGDGCGIDGTGYTLTIKNTSDVTLAEGTTHLNCARLVIADNGVFNPCSYYASKTKKYCVLTIPDGIILENGGKFVSWAHDSNGTPNYSTPIFVREGSGTISSSKKYYTLSGAITVQTGTTLNCTTTIGPGWYSGAITNETDATLNISGESSVCGGIFRNDGTVNHTAAKFVLGHRDNANSPCAVENNGIIRTSGGTFIFKAESSMTGTGTLELAGGSPSVAGKLSGFTGTIRVSGATATINNIATFPGTLVLANGTVSTSLSGVTCPVVFDLSGKTAPFTIPSSWLTLPSGKSVTVNLDGRDLSGGEQLIAWTETPDLEFSLDEASSQGGGRLLSTADGLYYAVGDVVITSALWTGAANDGDFSNPGNWSCLDQDGNIITGVIPSAGITVTLNADVASAWSQFDLSEGRVIDLNGHRLVVGIDSDSAVSLTVVDNSTDEENPGELRLMIDSGVTFTRTDSLAISGNLSLVKDGPGTFVWGEGTLAADIPIIISGGTFKLGVKTANVFGSSGTITVNGTGQFDLNYSVENGSSPVRNKTFNIEGDGPDGSGAIVNNADSSLYGYHLGHVVMTGDATIGGCGFVEIRGSGNGIDCGGYELTVKNAGRLLVEAGTYLTNATDIVVDGGRLQVCNSCTLGADRIVLQNGGTFMNFMSSGTKDYNVPFVVRAGSETSAITNTITTDKNYFTMNKPITVESGAVLSLPKGGPWYAGFTNKTDATIVVSGGEVCLTTDSILKNDGVLDHIGGKLYVGHRDDDIGACTVENNGLIRSAGGEFVFKTQSSMTGTGTLELAGGSPQVLGDLSGFTGTVVVSNGVAITFAGMNCGGTVAVHEGSTLTVDATSESATRAANMTLAAGSTLNIANYNGATPIEVAGSTTLPSDGTVNLKLNGGAFGEGIYAICKMSGVTPEAGAKFAPLTSTDDLKVGWSVDEDDTLVLTVGDVSGNTWTGGANNGNLSDPKNWLGGAVPESGTATINTTGTLTVGDTFRPDVIVFPETCGAVTIKGENAITGLTAITNLSVSTCTFEVPVAFADKICVSQGAYYGFSNDNPVLKDGGKVRFAGGVTGASFADGTSRRLDGAFTIPATANWTANSSAELWTVTGNSSLTITDSSSDQPASTDLSWLNNNGAFTTAVIRTSARICVRNEGDYVVTEELAMTLPGADRHIAQRASHTGKYKFEKVTLGDNGTYGVFYFANSGAYYMDKHVYIGNGGLCFAEGAQPNTAYAFGRRDNDKIYIYPWHSDYAINGKGGSTRDLIIFRATTLYTDDESGVARTVTLNGVADVRAALTVKGRGRFQVNSDGINGENVSSRIGSVTVTDSATLSYASGADLGAGAVTVGANATMEVASGEHTFDGGLTLNDGATLAFNFTERTVTPQIAIAEGKTLTVNGAVKVKIPAQSKWPTGGEKVLTTCGGFDAEGVTVSLAEGAPRWVRGLSVVDGNIVLDVKPMGTRVIVR